MKRYEVAPHGDTLDMTPAADGAWVLWEDVAALVAAEHAKLRKAIISRGGVPPEWLAPPKDKP